MIVQSFIHCSKYLLRFQDTSLFAIVQYCDCLLRLLTCQKLYGGQKIVINGENYDSVLCVFNSRLVDYTKINNSKLTTWRQLFYGGSNILKQKSNVLIFGFQRKKRVYKTMWQSFIVNPLNFKFKICYFIALMVQNWS